jgi:hypothetical protein
MPVNVPLMSKEQAVKETFDELLDPRVRLSFIYSAIHHVAMQKMGTDINPTFRPAVFLEMNKQMQENECYAAFWKALKELKRINVNG